MTGGCTLGGIVFQIIQLATKGFSANFSVLQCESREMHPARIVLSQRLNRPSASRRRRAIKASVALIAGLLIMNCAGAAMAAQYRLNGWTAENGLPQNVIRGIAQTRDSYLWIATLDGVARFDGVRFTVFNKSTSPGIASNRFGAMLEDQHGDLWFTSEGGSVTRYHRGSFHTYGPEEGIPANSIRGLAQDSAGNLWMLSEESIEKWSAETGLRDITPDNLRMHYEPLYWDNRGFWAQDKSSLHIFSDGRFESYFLPAWLEGGSIWNVGIDGNGTVWPETNDGKQGVIPAGKRAVEAIAPAHPRAVSYRDPHGHVWNFHVGQRLMRFFDFGSS